MMVIDCASKDEIETLILSATRQGNVELLQTYLLTLKNPNIYLNQIYNEPYEQKCTLLMIACLNEYEDMVDMLLNNFQPDLEILNIVSYRS